MIVTARSEYPGKIVREDLGIVVAYDDNIRIIRMNLDMDTYVHKALQRLGEKAVELGANAVLGVSFAMRGEAKPIVMGSAVILVDDDRT